MLILGHGEPLGIVGGMGGVSSVQGQPVLPGQTGIERGFPNFVSLSLKFTP